MVAKELVESWAEEYKQGLSLKEIAEKHNCSISTVYNYIRDKVSIRSRKKQVENVQIKRKRGRPPKVETIIEEQVKDTANEEISLKYLKFEQINDNSYCAKYSTNAIGVYEDIKEDEIVKEEIVTNNTKISEETINTWIKLAENNITYKEIAERYNVKYSVVYYRIKDKTKNKNTLSNNLKQQIRELQFQGLTGYKISKKLKIPKDVVYTYLKEIYDSVVTSK